MKIQIHPASDSMNLQFELWLLAYSINSMLSFKPEELTIQEVKMLDELASNAKRIYDEHNPTEKEPE